MSMSSVRKVEIREIKLRKYFHDTEREMLFIRAFITNALFKIKVN